MGKRMSLVVVPLVMALIVALPGTALAADFRTTVERDVCTPGAGKYGYGLGKLRVRLVEYGVSGANKFTYQAKVQHQNLDGGRWRDEYFWERAVSRFPNDADSYWNSRIYTYAPNHDAYHRIVVSVGAWHNRQLLYSRTIRGVSC